jgi:putative PIN family toxin of toxin-antitoxin system
MSEKARKMRVVIDTNVIVSALMNVNGIPAKILSQVLNGNMKVLYDNRILFEYMDVLTRKKFSFDAWTVNDLINYIKYDGEFINAGHLNVKFQDESDKKFYEVYKSGEADYLITGNIKHFPDDDTIVTPRKIIDNT